jgi:hypothetical protein
MAAAAAAGAAVAAASPAPVSGPTVGDAVLSEAVVPARPLGTGIEEPFGEFDQELQRRLLVRIPFPLSLSVAVF